MENIYNKYSEHLKMVYGEKVYKLPINLPITCPNRDGRVAVGGCTFCGDYGAGYEALDNQLTVSEQINKNMEYIGKRYNAKKFIAYFQNYSNTYMPLEQFEKYMKDAVVDNVVEIAVSTRPDCISEDKLIFLSQLRNETGVNITIELGLQTANYKSLIKINRGHTLAEYIQASILIKKYNIKLCTHVILNLPFDEMVDVIETAKIITVVGSDYVKLHSLNIVKNTKMATQYENNEFELLSEDDYKERVKTFLMYLDSNISVQRIIGRADKDEVVACNWGKSWWKIRDEIEEEMVQENIWQGKLCNYKI